MIWLRPSSSMAIEERIILIASSLVMEGLMVGKLGCDIKKNLL
jgi:hypothetical protein